MIHAINQNIFSHNFYASFFSSYQENQKQSVVYKRMTRPTSLPRIYNIPMYQRLKYTSVNNILVNADTRFKNVFPRLSYISFFQIVITSLSWYCHIMCYFTLLIPPIALNSNIENILLYRLFWQQAFGFSVSITFWLLIQ